MSLQSDMENLRNAVINFFKVCREEAEVERKKLWAGLDKFVGHYVPTKPLVSALIAIVGILGLGYFMVEDQLYDAGAWFIIWGVILYLVAKPSGEKNEEDTSDRRSGN